MLVTSTCVFSGIHRGALQSSEMDNFTINIHKRINTNKNNDMPRKFLKLVSSKTKSRGENFTTLSACFFHVESLYRFRKKKYVAVSELHGTA